MTTEQIDRWLFEHGGPAIRYRVATELGSDAFGADAQELAQALLASEQVQRWLDRLEPDFRFNSLHGSKPTCYENVMGKLTQLGVRAGMRALDERVLPFIAWLEEKLQTPDTDLAAEDLTYRVPMVAAFLMRAGYGHEPAVASIAQRRLDTLYEFCKQGRYDIYVEPDGYPTIPKSYRAFHIIDPALTQNGNVSLPNLHDMTMLAALPDDMRDEVTERKLDAIVNYILDDRYQRLDDAYGIILMSAKRYWVMGWSVHLPGYFASAIEAGDMRWIVRRMELMSHFRAARQHEWYERMLGLLSMFQNADARYAFPRNYLREGQTGYWLMGVYMGLEENRRSPRAIELESTFWMRVLSSTMK